MLRTALVVLLQVTQTVISRTRTGETRDTDSLPASTFSYILSPKDGRWLLPQSSFRFEEVVIYDDVTDEDLVCDAVLSIDDQVLAQWHAGCGDCKIWYDLPSHVLSEGSHRAHLHLNAGDPMTTVQVVTVTYHVVAPPKVELSLLTC